MAVFAYADSSNGKIPKSALEAVYYASKVAETLQTDTVALVVGDVSNDDLEGLGNYGATKVLKVTDEKLNNFDSQAYSKVIAAAIESANADIIIFSHNYVSKSVAPRLSAKLKAGVAVAVVDLPKTEDGVFIVKRTVYAGKAFAYFTINAEKKIIAIQPNSLSPETTDNKATVEDFKVELADSDFGVEVKKVNKVTDKIPLTEATVVVSGGRGMKGGENWGMLEELADVLGAALSCSKPVADMDWRPHSEHVGQTGITVRPNLYFAIGISGAIQHLAGVNGSKYIVAINTDSEAPIFKAADYGIVGDAFQVIPKLTEAAKKLKE